MNEITIPIWLFAVSAGVPCLSFISLLFFILRKIRKPNAELFIQMPKVPKEETHTQNFQFHHDLLALQIDTVFNGLNAIIETERVKMSTLLNSPINIGTGARQPQHDSKPHQAVSPVVSVIEPSLSLEEQIAEIAETGGHPEDIADEMGISQAEVELALQMRSSRVSMQHRKLEAVA